jgi:hypothetical protein
MPQWALPSLAGFSQNSYCATYFLSTAKRSKQERPLANLYSSSNDQVNLAG